MTDEEKNICELYAKAIIKLNIKDELSRRGCNDIESVLQLIDRTGIFFDGDSEVVTGAVEAVERFVAEKPYFFSPPPQKNPPARKRSLEGIGW